MENNCPNRSSLNCCPSTSGLQNFGRKISEDFPTNTAVDSVKKISEDTTSVLINSTNDNGKDENSTRLTLAYERLSEVPKAVVNCFAENIVYLDISHNHITNLDILVYFGQLTSLIADNNPLTEDCILPPLPKLQLLWLNHCKISSLYPWAGKLKESCPNLEYLSLMGNPAAPSYFNGGTFYEYLQYRLFLISQFPYLNHLDDRKVTEDQIEEAQRLYKRPFFERMMRPSARGIKQIVNSSVKWGTVHGKLTSFLGTRRERNHPI